MKIRGLEPSQSHLARGLCIVRFAAALDVAAQRRARGVLIDAGALLRSNVDVSPDDLEAQSAFVAGLYAPTDNVGRIREGLDVLAKELGATEATFVQVATEIDAVAYATDQADDDDDDDAADDDEDAADDDEDVADDDEVVADDDADDGPRAHGYWKAGPPPGVTTTAFALERYPSIVEDYDWEDFGLAVKLSGAPIAGERTVLEAIHAFWLAPYFDSAVSPKTRDTIADAAGGEDEDETALGAMPYRHARVSVDPRHRAALLWVDRFMAPAPPDVLVHHLMWVATTLHEVLPIAYARFDHATMAMKYGLLSGNPEPVLVLAANPLLGRFEAEGEAAAMAWAETQTTFGPIEVAAMFVELGQTHEPDEPESSAIALRMFERAVTLDPKSEEAMASAYIVLVHQGRTKDAVARAQRTGILPLQVLELVGTQAPASVAEIEPLLTAEILVDVEPALAGSLAAAAAEHAPSLLAKLLSVLPDTDQVAYLFNAIAATTNQKLQLPILQRVLAMPPPDADAGPHRQAYAHALNNACVIAHALGDYPLAVMYAERANEFGDENPAIHHAAACAYAAVGEHVLAFTHVRAAVRTDYEHLDRLAVDTDLGPILEWPEHQKLFEAWRARMAKSERVLSATDASFDAQVLAHDRPVIVDFTASWCGPCQRLAPIVERLAAESGGRYRVVKLDVDESEETASRFGVKSMPTLVVFNGGAERARHLGLTSKAKLKELLVQGGVDFTAPTE